MYQNRVKSKAEQRIGSGITGHGREPLDEPQRSIARPVRPADPERWIDERAGIGREDLIQHALDTGTDVEPRRLSAKQVIDS